MNSWLKRNSTALLRWTVGLVVLLQSSWFALAASPGHGFKHMGLPEWFRPALGGSEALAALLFLVPATALVGSYFLLLIFALAILIHTLHGDPASGAGLLIYAAAVIECMVRRNEGGTDS